MQSRYVTLASGVVLPVDNFTEDASEVEVINITGTVAVYFTVSGTGALPAAPAVGADDTYCLPAAIGSLVVPLVGNNPPKVRLIALGTPEVGVIATP